MSFERFKKRIRGDFQESPEENNVVSEDTSVDFLDRVSDMTKEELDRYVEENFNIRLDRRKSKKNMVEEFKTLYNEGEE